MYDSALGKLIEPHGRYRGPNRRRGLQVQRAEDSTEPCPRSPPRGAIRPHSALMRAVGPDDMSDKPTIRHLIRESAARDSLSIQSIESDSDHLTSARCLLSNPAAASADCYPESGPESAGQIHESRRPAGSLDRARFSNVT